MNQDVQAIFLPNIPISSIIAYITSISIFVDWFDVIVFESIIFLYFMIRCNVRGYEWLASAV